jgi:hypothetical protein
MRTSASSKAENFPTLVQNYYSCFQVRSRFTSTPSSRRSSKEQVRILQGPEPLISATMILDKCDICCGCYFSFIPFLMFIRSQIVSFNHYQESGNKSANASGSSIKMMERVMVFLTNIVCIYLQLLNTTHKNLPSPGPPLSVMLVPFPTFPSDSLKNSKLIPCS